MQLKYYKWILTKDTKVFSKDKNSLMNGIYIYSYIYIRDWTDSLVVVNLRKCCNHPYLFNGAEPLFDGEYKR